MGHFDPQQETRLNEVLSQEGTVLCQSDGKLKIALLPHGIMTHLHLP